jgi:hypothetical protein
MQSRGLSGRVLPMISLRYVGEVGDFAWFTSNDVSIAELFEAARSIGSQTDRYLRNWPVRDRRRPKNTNWLTVTGNRRACNS